jgi:hypothetical protein
MDKINQRLARPGFGMKRAIAISRLLGIQNPAVKKVQEQVRDERRRKFQRISKGANELARKKVKTEFQAKILEDEMETVKVETMITGY